MSPLVGVGATGFDPPFPTQYFVLGADEYAVTKRVPQRASVAPEKAAGAVARIVLRNPEP